MKCTYKITGVSPLLVHSDDVEKSDMLTKWRKDGKNKAVSTRGDDRSPAWTWQTYLYTDGVSLVIPTDNLSACIREAATTMTLSGMKSFKEASMCGLVFHDDFLPIIGPLDRAIQASEIDALAEMTFAEQSEAVKALGFSLFVKRAKVGSAKHVRVRPRFDQWSLSGTVEVIAKEIEFDHLKEMFELGGFYKGLCDWRPGSPKRPGRFGRFTAEIKKS